MTTTSGIWNHAATQSASPMLTPMDSSSNGSDNSTSGSATISANDFLTLLVTEMQNQDPTADTDPNEYINQLVNVNSLEQLIGINQTLTTAFGGTTGAGSSTGNGSSGTSPGSDALGATGAIQEAASSASHVPANAGLSKFGLAPSSAVQQPSTLHLAPGNLSVPSTNPSAQRVAQSLSGH